MTTFGHLVSLKDDGSGHLLVPRSKTYQISTGLVLNVGALAVRRLRSGFGKYVTAGQAPCSCVRGNVIGDQALAAQLLRRILCLHFPGIRGIDSTQVRRSATRRGASLEDLQTTGRLGFAHGEPA